jgi:Flp pilus assembly protein TadG
MGDAMDMKICSKAAQKRRQGMAMLEAVIVLPLLLMLLFAIAEFGIMFGRYQMLSNAAREGARTAVVFRSSCTAATVEAEVRDRVKFYVQPLGITLADADIAVTGVCGAPSTSSSVTVDFEHPFVALPGLAPSVGPTINLVGTSVMRNEG